MDFAIWLSLGGALLVLMALSGTMFARLPLSTAMLYLGVGVALSPVWLGAADLRMLTAAPMLERLTEAVVLISLFTSGLKLSVGLNDRRWLPPLRLALLAMLISVAAVTLIGTMLMGLSLGAALLLGGILAPTDPVLASDVQVTDAADRDALRFALTAEGGLNDGTAFPVVMLGLGLLGLHEIGEFGWRWLAVDLLWASAAGLAIGALLGSSLGRLVLYLRREHKEAVGYDNFLALGLIGLSYGLALLCHAYGFLAVFAAGVALRKVERQAATRAAADAPANAMLGFNEQLDRIGELCAVIVIGLLLWAVQWQHASWWFVAALLLAVRPVSVALGLAGARILPAQRRLIGWFGIRGVGSLFYLAYAINHGIEPALAEVLTALVLSAVAASIVVHGISVTPLMTHYATRRR